MRITTLLAGTILAGTLRTVALLMLLTFGGLAQANDEGPEHLFDFLIGDHDVTLHAWTGSAWTPPRPVSATWSGRRGLAGDAIYDEWIDPQGGKGVNVRVYDPDQAIWKMMWISTSGYQVADLRAETREGVLTMWQVYPERPGWHAEFSRLDACTWTREGFQASESGELVPQFRLIATRRHCEVQ